MIKHVLKDSAIYGLGNILTKFIGLMLMPILTRYLSPEEYGTWDLLHITTVIAHMVIGLEILHAMVFYVSSAKSKEEHIRIASTAFWSSVCLYTIGSLLTFIYATPLSRILFDTQEHTHLMQWTAGWLFSYGLFNLLLNQCRAEQKAPLFALLIFMNTFIGVGAAILTLTLWDMGILGILMSYTITSTLLLSIAYFMLRHTLTVYISWSLFIKLLIFSVPLMPSTGAIFGQIYSDRIILNMLTNLENVGIYGVAFRIGSLMQILTFAVQMSFLPILLKNHEKPETRQHLQHIFLFYMGIGMSCLVGLTLFAPEFFWLVVGENFYEALPIVPWLASAFLLAAVPVFMPGLWITKKTPTIAAINIFGLVLNILLNLVLIPHFGITGSAMATLCANVLVAIIHYVFSHKHYAVTYQFLRVGIASIATLSLLLWIVPHQYVHSVTLHILMLKTLLWGISTCILGYILFPMHTLKLYSEDVLNKVFK